jgi:hypothetical protein
MSRLPFDIKTFDYNSSPEDLQPGDEVYMEAIIKGEGFKSEGIIENQLDMHSYNVRFTDKYGEERVMDFLKEHIYSKKIPTTVRHVGSFPEYNCIIVRFEDKTNHLIDLNNPSVVKYKFSTNFEDCVDKKMISSKHLLGLAFFREDFGKGHIIDMSDEKLNVTLKRSEETAEFVKDGNYTDTPVHLIKDNHLYLSNGKRILVFDILTGDEIWSWIIDDTKEVNFPSLALLNGQVFTNNRRRLIRLPEISSEDGAIIEAPEPLRFIYTENKIHMFSKFFSDTVVNPRKELLVCVHYQHDIEHYIFSPEEVIDMIDLVENRNFPKIIHDKIKEKFAALRKKYPSLKIIFKHKEILDILMNTDFQTVKNAYYKEVLRRYETEYSYYYYLYSDECDFIGGLSLSNERLWKAVSVGGVTTDRYTYILFPEKKYEYITKEMVIRHTLCQTLHDMIMKISKVVKYQDVSGQPLAFYDYFAFDGTEFIRKEYPEKISIWSEITSNKVKLNIDGEEIPDFGHNYPKTMIKSNYYVETEVMPYYQAVELENIRLPGVKRERPSKDCFLTYAINDYSNSMRCDEQNVTFFIWKEDFATIKIPLSFSPRQGAQCGYGQWINSCYVVYNLNYVRIVHVK